MLKRFFKAVLPSMLAFAFSGLYTIVDGFFIGRNIGDLGLAAVNIAYPMAALVQAAGTGIGMGGAVWITLHRGKQEEGQEMECLGNTMTLLLSGGLLESTAFYWETRGWQTRQSHKSILKGIVKMPAKYFW